MPEIGIRVMGLEGRVTVGTGNPRFGEWVREYDPDARQGRGELVTTKDPRQAKRFRDVQEAMTFYGQTSRVRPVREDGEPNKPLTAFTVELAPIPEEGEA